MADQQVIIHSPNAEQQQALGSRVEETVQMSSYKIKKALKAARGQAMKEYVELGDVESVLRDTTFKIKVRLTDLMNNYLQEKALPILNLMSDFFEVGADGTYFDDNRGNEIAYNEIAQSIIDIDNDINFWDPATNGRCGAYVHGSLNFFGSTEANPSRTCEDDLVFTPQKVCQYFELTVEEAEHLDIVKATESSRRRANHDVNDIDRKLESMDELQEDIRYAMLSEKNQGDSGITDIATKIAEAYINGTDPSALLLTENQQTTEEV